MSLLLCRHNIELVIRRAKLSTIGELDTQTRNNNSKPEHRLLLLSLLEETNVFWLLFCCLFKGQCIGRDSVGSAVRPVEALQRVQVEAKAGKGLGQGKG